jgi:hypothetical protein
MAAQASSEAGSDRPIHTVLKSETKAVAEIPTAAFDTAAGWWTSF